MLHRCEKLSKGDKMGTCQQCGLPSITKCATWWAGGRAGGRAGGHHGARMRACGRLVDSHVGTVHGTAHLSIQAAGHALADAAALIYTAESDRVSAKCAQPCKSLPSRADSSLGCAGYVGAPGAACSTRSAVFLILYSRNARTSD